MFYHDISSSSVRMSPTYVIKLGDESFKVYASKKIYKSEGNITILLLGKVKG